MNILQTFHTKKSQKNVFNIHQLLDVKRQEAVGDFPGYYKRILHTLAFIDAQI